MSSDTSVIFSLSRFSSFVLVDAASKAEPTRVSNWSTTVEFAHEPSPTHAPLLSEISPGIRFQKSKINGFLFRLS